MSQRTRKYLAVGLFASLAVSFATKSAHAQAWLKDRRYSEGPGWRVGDFELHPGIGGEVGYDSNWFLRSSKDNVINGAPNNPPTDGATFRLTPSLSLSTLGEQRKEGVEGAPAEPGAIAFRAGLSATYREYIGKAELRDQRNVSVNADARLDIFPKRPITFSILAGYVRTIRPNVVGDPSVGFNTSNPYAGAELTWTPNNGTFDTTVGYNFNATLFEQSAGAPFTNLRHEFALRNRWRFRPRTAIFHESTVGILGYTDPNRSVNFLADSIPLRTKIGLNGLITPRFAALAAIGYGGSFYDAKTPAARQFDSIIAQAEARFYLTDNPETSDPGKLSLTQSSLAVGYTRDFENSYLGNFYGVDKGYLSLSYFFGGRVLLSLTGGVSALSYPDVFLAGQNAPVNASFTVVRPEAQLFGEYRFTDSFAVNATFTYMQNISSTQITYGPGQLYDMSWNRFTAFAGARWFL